MEFNKGMIGVLLVILSLVGSVAIGVITNIESNKVDKDVEEYVADITGGFESEKEKSYTDYNPSNNYNGYTNKTYSNRFAVDFEPSSYVNNYPLTYSENPITYDVMDTSAANIPWGGSSTNLYYEIYGYTSVDTKANYDSGNIVKVVKFSDFLDDIMPSNTDNLKYIEITISTAKDSEGRATNTASIITGPNRMVFDESYAWVITSRLFGSSTSSDYSKAPYSNGVGAPFRSLTQEDGSTVMVKLRYDIQNDAVAFYLANGETLTTSPATDVYITGTHTIHDRWEGDITTTSDIYVSYSYENSTKYIDTRYGVGIRNDETVEWSNKQRNGITSIVFSVWDGTTKTFTDPPESTYSDTGIISYYDTADTDTFTISRTNGRTSIALNDSTAIDIGTWNQIQIDINNIDGVMTAYPVGVWDNFNNYSLYGTSVEIGQLTKANMKNISWTANNSFRLQVSNTRVFFNSYGVVMIDPHITIANLWPNYDKFSIHIFGVATIGKSIKIGDTEYTLTNNIITVNGTNIDITDMSIEYTKRTVNDSTKWDITVSSGKNSATMSESNTYLGFNGSWYFSAGFYEIVTKKVIERTWNPIYDWGKGHIFFWMAGILLILGIAAYKIGYMDGVSAIIIIIAEIILFIIGGTT